MWLAELRITSGGGDVGVTGRVRVGRGVVVVDGVAQGSCWCTLLDTAASAHGPGVVLKRKGTTTALARGTCPPPHPTLPYITPVRAAPIGHPCWHSHPVGDQGNIYPNDLAIAQKSPLRRQNTHQATYRTLVCRPTEPSKHPHRASYDPVSVVSPASRCAFPSILPCTIVHPYASGRSEPRTLKLSVMFYSCLPAAVLHG